MTSLPFDADAVRSLAMILADTGLTEIEIEGKEGRIRVVRALAPVAPPPAAMVSLNQAAPPASPAPAASPTAPAAQDDVAHPGAVLSPMVGVAYLAAEPGSAPYVSLGQTVVAGQTVMLIEAMKTFNQIKAPKAGTVTRILIAAGAPVEFGQPLMIIE
jgi:acetyl-CoA carboxylase biotin carboxyl carrier protein